jgi:hypothetical protein
MAWRCNMVNAYRKDYQPVFCCPVCIPPIYSWCFTACLYSSQLVSVFCYPIRTLFFFWYLEYHLTCKCRYRCMSLLVPHTLYFVFYLMENVQCASQHLHLYFQLAGSSISSISDLEQLLTLLRSNANAQRFLMLAKIF